MCNTTTCICFVKLFLWRAQMMQRGRGPPPIISSFAHDCDIPPLDNVRLGCILETHPESPLATALSSFGGPNCGRVARKVQKNPLTFIESMLLHRYGQPRRSLPYQPARHPPPGWHRAGLRQHSPPFGFGSRPGSGRDGHLEGGRPHPPALGAFAGTETPARRGPAVGAEADAAGPGVTVMMGTRSAQDKLFAADQIYLDYVGRDTLYGYLAQNRQHLFRDEDFAALYCGDNGRTSVAPSLAISVLFLRAYERVSFVEAVDRTKYDLRWKVALGLEMEEVPMQKSTLQEFEAKLVLQDRKSTRL